MPYAQPPLESLRFERPQKLTAWQGTKLADTFGPVCPQVRGCVGTVDEESQANRLINIPEMTVEFLIPCLIVLRCWNLLPPLYYPPYLVFPFPTPLHHLSFHHVTFPATASAAAAACPAASEFCSSE